ncbi:putative Aflatoxin regulatory protein domain-containing protein [Seiridium unicorne]|uniref:Aflatoxin regulatory protein domain-containing protein n=1 Tax=Seiridium unicorne TaxID=138068 RepID=A0ABR2VGD5_9PEZI
MASNFRQDSLDDADGDSFYSFPPSRNVSRHVSIEPGRTPESILSLRTALNANHLTAEDNRWSSIMTPRNDSSRIRWRLPFKYHREPRHRHFWAKPMLDRFAKGRTSSRNHSDNTHDGDIVTALPEEPITIEQLVSPAGAADPVTTKQWSSTSIGSSLRAVKSYSLEEVCFDDSLSFRRGLEDIMADIRTYLSDRRHDDCPFADSLIHSAGQRQKHPEGRGIDRHQSENHVEDGPAEDGPAEDGPTENFLISAADLVGILDIVIHGLPQVDREQPSTGCLSILLPTATKARPSTTSNSIILAASCLAEPVTTIGSVKPSFTVIGDKNTQYGVTNATIISKQSVTEVS